MAAGTALAAPAAGQQPSIPEGWLPGVRLFEGPVADPREPRLSGGFLATDLFAVREQPPAERPPFGFDEPPEDLERDIHAVVTVGGTLPLWSSVVDREVAVLVAPQLAVFNRFRMEKRSRDDVGGDWVVALPLEFRVGPRVSGRVRLVHRSAHLGDEVGLRGAIERLEFSYEAMDALVGVRPTAATRLYGGGTLILASNTFRVGPRIDPRDSNFIKDFEDRAVLQAGAEAGASRREGIGLVGAVDLQWAERTGWATQLSALAGVAAELKGRRARLTLRLLDGPSPMGEFFLTDELAFGVDLLLEL